MSILVHVHRQTFLRLFPFVNLSTGFTYVLIEPTVKLARFHQTVFTFRLGTMIVKGDTIPVYNGPTVLIQYKNKSCQYKRP